MVDGVQGVLKQLLAQVLYLQIQLQMIDLMKEL